MATFFYWIYKSIKTYKWLALAFLIVVCGFFGFSISKIQFQENIRDVLPQDENIGEVSDIVENLSLSNRIVVLVSDSVSANPDGLIATAKGISDSLLVQYPELISDIQLKISNQKFDQLFAFYQANLPFYLEEGDYAQLANRLNADSIPEGMQRMYRVLASPMGMVGNKFILDDPLNIVTIPLLRAQDLRLDQEINLYKNHLISSDQQNLLFFVDLANPGAETDLNGKLIDGLSAISASIAANQDGLEMVYFGSPAMAVANARQIKSDIHFTLGIALTFLLLFISFYYRKISTFLLVLLPGLFGALAAVSVLAIMRDSVSVISLAIGSVLLGITIDYALHMLTHIKHEKDVKKVFKDLTFPTIICSLTSATAFMSLMLIRSTALQDLGIFAGVSIFTASLFTMIVFPHILLGKNKKVQKPASENVVEKAVNKLAAYPFHKKIWALLIVIAITIVSAFTWSNYGFEDDMLKLNYAPDELVDAEKKIQAVSSIANNNLYLATSGDDLNAALTLNQRVTDSLTLWSETGQVDGFLNLNRMVPTTSIQGDRLENWNSFWDNHSLESVENTVDSEAAALGFEPEAFEKFKTTLSHDYSQISDADIRGMASIFGDDFIVDKENGNVTLITLVKVSSGTKANIASRLGQIESTRLIDRQSVANQLVSLLEQDFNKLVLYSLIAVFVILLLSYGRIEQALLVYIPILLSWLWVLGLMGLFGLKFNIVNVIVCTFIFGIGVDYSIFVAHGLFQTGGKEAGQFSTYKRAIILSAITTLVGIGALIFAEHPAIKSIALLTIIGITATIVITFTIQPLLFNVFVGNRKRKGFIPFTISSVFISAFAFSYFLLGCLLLTVLRWIFFLPIGSMAFRKAVFHKTISRFCGSLVWIMSNFPKEYIDLNKADFSKPSVIIANHHSFLDILFLLRLDPRVVMVTNTWVYNSPFFGKTVQFADFIHASDGVENQFEQIKEKVDKGFSIIIFPEGSRSPSQKLRRFHKGGFFLAEKLNLDIQPVLIHGTNYTMPKGDDFYLKNGKVTLKFLDRITPDEQGFGQGYSERTKAISKYFKAEHAKLRTEVETPSYFHEMMLKNYLYRSPILEWYFKVKIRLENHYEPFHNLLPTEGAIMDLGCGYGFMSYALGLSAPGRKFTSVDYDSDKIAVANDCAVKPENITFKQGDVATIDLEKSDAFILSDVLHYLEPAEQLGLMKRMAENLNAGGKIIVRDSDASNEKRHQGSKLTEFFSTNFGFNQTRNNLNFVSREFFERFAEDSDMELEIIDNTKLTSNLIFVFIPKIG